MLSRKGRVRRWTLGSQLTTGVIGGEHELHEMLALFFLVHKAGFVFLWFLFFWFSFFSFVFFSFFPFPKGKNRKLGTMKSVDGPPSPGSLDPIKAQVTTPAGQLDPPPSSRTSISTLEPYELRNVMGETSQSKSSTRPTELKFYLYRIRSFGPEL